MSLYVGALTMTTTIEVKTTNDDDLDMDGLLGILITPVQEDLGHVAHKASPTIPRPQSLAHKASDVPQVQEDLGHVAHKALPTNPPHEA